MREILFYETKPGYSPVIDFIESLPSKEAQKTPRLAIKTAEKRKKEYLNRGNVK